MCYIADCLFIYLHDSLSHSLFVCPNRLIVRSSILVCYLFFRLYRSYGQFVLVLQEKRERERKRHIERYRQERNRKSKKIERHFKDPDTINPAQQFFPQNFPKSLSWFPPQNSNSAKLKHLTIKDSVKTKDQYLASQITVNSQKVFCIHATFSRDKLSSAQQYENFSVSSAN